MRPGCGSSAYQEHAEHLTPKCAGKLAAAEMSQRSQEERVRPGREKPCRSPSAEKYPCQEEVRKTSRCISSAKARCARIRNGRSSDGPSARKLQAEKNQLLHEIHEEKDKLDRLWEQALPLTVACLSDAAATLFQRAASQNICLRFCNEQKKPRLASWRIASRT